MVKVAVLLQASQKRQLARPSYRLLPATMLRSHFPSRLAWAAQSRATSVDLGLRGLRMCHPSDCVARDKARARRVDGEARSTEPKGMRHAAGVP